MLPTLKGVFPQPKLQHKRDFLRENKLHLKSIQSNSSRQQLQKAEEEQKLAELRRRQRHKSLDARSFLSRRRPSSGCSCQCAQVVSCCRPNSGESEPRKVDTCNREVQTDDILDEQFLYQALQRCSSTDVGHTARSNKVLEDDQRSGTTSDNHYDSNDHDLNFENLAIDTDRQQPPTACSTQIGGSRRTIRKPHELGDRLDIRLPKYLEREKREKELQRQKELLRDLDCPVGYVAVPEKDRETALKKAEKKFQDLVDELNRMPMTTETLRIRTRKVEIERELVEIENDIRIFSKPKVYVKANGVY